jgi:hypothetical protein
MSYQTGLTIPAAALRAGVDQTAIREAIHRGEIPARQTFVVQPADVDTWAARGSEKR